MKTISALQPRVAILENVKAISNNANNKVVTKALSTLKGYIVCYFKLNSLEFGVPQHRPRIYMVALRKDQLLPMLQDKSPNIIQAYLQRKIDKLKVVDFKTNFHAFLKDLGCPILPFLKSEQSLQSEQSLKSDCDSDDDCDDEECGCANPLALCPLHVCKCHLCKTKPGTKCSWRKSHSKFSKTTKFKVARRQYLLMWRKVKKDKTLKTPPSYFEIANRTGLSTNHIKQPVRRNILHTLSMAKNMNKKDVILNLGKSIGRNQVRTDGLVPPLGHGCSGFFVPSAARYLTMPQLMCLSGFHPKLNSEHFAHAKDVSMTDMDLMIGNTMCLPLVGMVMASSLSLVVG